MPGKLHNILSEMALRWLNCKVTGRGLRGGYEVPIVAGYVADAVGLCAFQSRFCDLYIGDKNYKRINPYCVIRPEVACIFEAKATRSDFLSTFGKSNQDPNRATPVGNLHWCVCGRGIAKPEELPDFWGLLSVRGTGLTEHKRPLFMPTSEATIHQIAYQVLWYAKSGHEKFVKAVYGSLEH